MAVVLLSSAISAALNASSLPPTITVSVRARGVETGTRPDVRDDVIAPQRLEQRAWFERRHAEQFALPCAADARAFLGIERIAHLDVRGDALEHREVLVVDRPLDQQPCAV